MLTQALGQQERAVKRRLGQQHGELFPTVAADDVNCAGLIDERLRDGAQHVVAGLMPVRVVDALEVVDVQHEERDGTVVADGALVLVGDAVLKIAPVVEAGERVSYGDIFETAVHRLHFGQVLLRLLLRHLLVEVGEL